MTPPLMTLLYITGDRDPLPALEASITGNRRDDVEWVVVDNRNRAFAGPQPAEVADTPVRWISSPPGDGHAALNRGAAAALGALVAPLLAGDELYAGSVSRLINAWRRIPAQRSARHSGVTGVAAALTPSGEITPSEPFGFEFSDLQPDELRYGQSWNGEPVFAMRVELLRARPLPSPGDPLPSLGMVWRVVGRGFLTHAMNAELAVRVLPAGRSIRTERFDALAVLTHDLGWFRENPRPLIEAARAFHVTSRELKVSPRAQWRALGSDGTKVLWLATWPLSRRDRRPNEGTSEAPSPAARSSGPVVLLVPSLDLATTGQMATLAGGLCRRHIPVQVIALAGGPLERELRDVGVPLTLIERHGALETIGMVRRLARSLREAKPAVVSSLLPGPNLLALLTRRFHRSRVVWNIRPLSEHRGLTGRAERWLARSVPALVVTSETERERASAAGYPAKRIVLVPTGIDLDRFRRDEEGRASLRSAWRVNSNAPLIGRVGRIEPQKDHATFLQTAAIVGRARPDARFVCIGGGPNSRVAEMQQLSRVLGLGDRVIWTGPVTVSASAYSAMDICVSSSSSGEGIPEHLAEAMACGTPVVATDIGDAAWLIGDDRAIVPPEDPGALAERLLLLLDQIEADLIDGATLRARIDRELSVERLLDRMETVLLGRA